MPANPTARCSNYRSSPPQSRRVPAGTSVARTHFSPAEPFLTKIISMPSTEGSPRSRPLSFRTARAEFSFGRTFFPLSETRSTGRAFSIGAEREAETCGSGPCAISPP
jgi:hypothetical protein